MNKPEEKPPEVPMTAEEKNYKMRTFQEVPDSNRVDVIEPPQSDEVALGGQSPENQQSIKAQLARKRNEKPPERTPQITSEPLTDDEAKRFVDQTFATDQIKRRRDIGLDGPQEYAEDSDAL